MQNTFPEHLLCAMCCATQGQWTQRLILLGFSAAWEDNDTEVPGTLCTLISLDYHDY